jgi:hypothetical protein
MQDNSFDPALLQRQIDGLFAENRKLKARLGGVHRLSEQGLPARWQKEFATLRRQNAKYRTERNEARTELAALRAERV